MKLSAISLLISALLAACGASQDQTRVEPRASVVTAACADDVTPSTAGASVESLSC